jgi:hypothetical protein
VRPLILEGDLIAGVGRVVSIGSVVVNNRGDWVAVVDTDNPDALRDEVVLRNGAVLVREGDAIAGPGPGRVVVALNSPTINNLGASSFTFGVFDTTRTPPGPESGLYLNLDPAAYSGQDAMFPVAPGEPFVTFVDSKINDELQVLARFTFIGSSFPSLAVLHLTPTGGVASRRLIHTTNDPAPGLPGRFFTGFEVLPTHTAFNNAGDVVFQGILDGETATNNAYFKNDLPIVQQGTASPVTGRLWGELSGTNSAVDMNNRGDWVVRGLLAGGPAADMLIVKNGRTFIQEGEAPDRRRGAGADRRSGAHCVVRRHQLPR